MVRSLLARWRRSLSQWRDSRRRQGRILALIRQGEYKAVPTGRGQSTQLIHRNRFLHPAVELDPQRIEAIYYAAECGDPRTQVALFDDLLERDPKTRNLYEQRAAAVSGRPWSIVPGGTSARDARAATRLEEALRVVPGFANTVQHWLGANLYGHAASEILWSFDRRGRLIVPARFADVHPSYFRIEDQTDELLLRTRSAPNGEPLDAGSWVIVARPGTQPLARRGLGRVTSLYSALKLQGVRNWTGYVARFGIPLLAIKAGLTATDTDQPSRAAAAEVLERLGEDMAAILAQDMELETFDGARPDASLHAAYCEWVDRQIATAVNGVTLANDGGATGATHALGRVHADIRWEGILRDARMIAEAFEAQVARPFVEFNALDARPPSITWHVVQQLAPGVVAQIFDIFVNKLGGDASVQQFRELTGFRPPVDDSDRMPGASAGGAGADAGPSEELSRTRAQLTELARMARRWELARCWEQLSQAIGEPHLALDPDRLVAALLAKLEGASEHPAIISSE
jgi:phage gp29-like protein